MVRKMIVLLLISLFTLPSLSFAENWVYIGESQNEGEKAFYGNWLDVDSIAPVGEMTNMGVAKAPFFYRLTYRTALDGDEAGAMVEKNVIFNVKTREILVYPEWASDPAGMDGFYFSAYLIRNLEEIGKHELFYDSSILWALWEHNEPEWEVDDKGWQQVYEIPGLGKAWVQTESAQLSSLEQGKLPMVRVLVRYQLDSESAFVYTYEEYNPETKKKQVLRVWDGKQKSFLFRRAMIYTVKVSSSEAVIATAAYSPFILDPTLVEARPFFTEGDNGAYRAGFFAEWLDFDKK